MSLVPNNLDRIVYNLIAKSVEIVDQALFNRFYANSHETLEVDVLVKRIKDIDKSDLCKNIYKDIYNEFYPGIHKLENLLGFELDNQLLPEFERFWSNYDVEELFARYNHYSQCGTKSAARALCFRPEWYNWVRNLSTKMELDPVIVINNIDLLMSESWLVKKRLMSAKFNQYQLADDLRFIKSYINLSLQKGI